jgi:hypothetical protein
VPVVVTNPASFAAECPIVEMPQHFPPLASAPGYSRDGPAFGSVGSIPRSSTD